MLKQSHTGKGVAEGPNEACSSAGALVGSSTPARVLTHGITCTRRWSGWATFLIRKEGNMLIFVIYSQARQGGDVFIIHSIRCV